MPDGAAAPAVPRTKWSLDMSRVKLAIEVATGASYSVEVSSETIETKEAPGNADAAVHGITNLRRCSSGP